MFESSAQIVKVSVLTVILVVFSTNTCAEIYKWRDARGVTKYSDIPPPFAFSKATRNELINALQAKDVCILPNTKTAKTIGTVSAKLASKTAASNGTQMNFAFNKGGEVVSSNAFGGNNVNSSPLNLAQNSPAASSSGRFIGRGFLPARKPNTLATLPVTPIAIKPAPVAAAPATVNTPPKQILAQAAPPTAANTPNTTPLDSVLPPNIVQVALMPAVDISKNISAAPGFSEIRIGPTEQAPVPRTGSFRIPCTVSHMSNDDPLVYPNQSGAAHHHTFYGNTSTNSKSDLGNMAIIGNSTCNGGIMNRTAYWVPSMIDSKTNTPIASDSALFYYKVGDFNVKPELIIAPPKGLRMITGNSKGNSVDTANGIFYCIDKQGNSTHWQRSIQSCPVGDVSQMVVIFPQCWDGVNLDSPDHKSHMAFPLAPGVCPATHPVVIPEISLNIRFTITKANQALSWRLASDNYANTSPGGYSAHADWVNGWDEKTMAGIVKNCLQKNLDCAAHLLGDGRMFY